MKERIYSIDKIRVLAIASVVFCHSFELFKIINNNVTYVLASEGSFIFHVLAYLFGRIGVPLFLFITGYLLIHREYDNKATKAFYKKNLLPMLFTWEIWIILLNIFLHIIGIQKFNIGTYLRNALFLENVNIGMAWYMPVIIGIYLFIPIISIVTKRIANRIAFTIIIISLFYIFIFPSLSFIMTAVGAPELRDMLDLKFSGGMYGLYVILGHYFYVYRKEIAIILKDVKIRIFSYAVLLSAILFSLYYSKTLFMLDFNYEYWYDFFPVLIISSIIFCLLIREQPPKITSSIFTKISKKSFGIYLIHQPIQMILHINFSNTLNSSYYIVNILTIFISSFGLSYIIVSAMSTSKTIGRILFLKK